MFLINIKVSCPRCSSSKVVKNGVKSTGKQNFLCKACGRQFQYEYEKPGCDPKVRHQIKESLLHGGGIRDNAEVFKVSSKTVLNIIKTEGENLKISPSQKHYSSVQIDELYSFVGNKGKKVWIFYVYAPETKEILAFTMGKRSIKQLRYLMLKIKHLNIQIDTYRTDDFKGFSNVLKNYNHLIGKEYTKHIEGRNTFIRARLARFQRRSTKFSKKLIYQWWLFTMLVDWLNNRALSYI
jgi:IS1 family transposase